MESNIKNTGVPMLVVADNGGDIKSGIDKFCDVHAKCDFVYDLKHKIATLLKKTLTTHIFYNNT
jgi:hypothetical protein